MSQSDLRNIQRDVTGLRGSGSTLHRSTETEKNETDDGDQPWQDDSEETERPSRLIGCRDRLGPSGRQLPDSRDRELTLQWRVLPLLGWGQGR